MRLALTIIFGLYSTSAQAYVDPGSQLLLMQGLLAFVGALVVFFRNPITAVRSLARRIAARFGRNGDA